MTIRELGEALARLPPEMADMEVQVLTSGRADSGEHYYPLARVRVRHEARPEELPAEVVGVILVAGEEA